MTTYQLDRNKQNIRIEGSNTPFRETLDIFLHEWFDECETIELQTSGSTGTPKKIQVEKMQMMESAKRTCNFLDLKKGDKTLLCMPLEYIAGKMIVVRALVAGLDLYPITPSGNPLKDTAVNFDFAAMIPLQVFNSLQNPIERERLKSIRTLIIGGGSIDSELEDELRGFPNRIYSTYGMSETLSHIALRRLNGSEASRNYYPFEEVKISLSDEHCLVINIAGNILETNDIAEIYDDGSFQILGRKDNRINCGGIKIQLEEVEEKLSKMIHHPFALTSCPDKKFGEILVLVSEKIIDVSAIEKILPPYQIPKKIIYVNHLPFTPNSKIDRVKLKKIATPTSN